MTTTQQHPETPALLASVAAAGTGYENRSHAARPLSRRAVTASTTRNGEFAALLLERLAPRRCALPTYVRGNSTAASCLLQAQFAAQGGRLLS